MNNTEIAQLGLVKQADDMALSAIRESIENSLNPKGFDNPALGLAAMGAGAGGLGGGIIGGVGGALTAKDHKLKAALKGALKGGVIGAGTLGAAGGLMGHGANVGRVDGMHKGLALGPHLERGIQNALDNSISEFNGGNMGFDEFGELLDKNLSR